MSVLPHLQIGKIGEHYPEVLAKTWRVAIKHSKILDHNNSPLSYGQADQDYLDKNKGKYAQILKNLGGDVLDVARQHDPNIDKTIESILNPGGALVIQDPPDDSVEATPPNKKRELSATQKWLAGTVGVVTLTTAIGSGILYYDYKKEMKSLSNLFEDQIYSVVQPSSPVEKCVLEGVAHAAAKTAYDMNKNTHLSSSGSAFSQSIWPDFKQVVYDVSDDCDVKHGAADFGLTEQEITTLASSLHHTLRNQ